MDNIMKHEEIAVTEEETKTILPEEQEKYSKELAEGEKPEELKDDSSVNALASSTNPDQKMYAIGFVQQDRIQNIGKTFIKKE